MNIGSASDGASAGAKTEADAQAKKTINSELYDPVYTYEAIVNAPPGIVHEPNPSWSKTGYYTEKSGPADIDLWRQHIIKAFEGVEPLPENATDQQINRLYNQILFVATHDYEPIDTIDRFPYMVFKKDHINPYTKQQIQENQQVNLEIVLDASGSMAAEIGGRPMMDIAKQSIKEVVQSMPANSRIGLRVFGHKGDWMLSKQSLVQRMN